MDPAAERPAPAAAAVLPEDMLRAPSGQPAAIVVRTARGWTVLGPDEAVPGLSLVEAMSLADLVTAEVGIAPEPDRAARRAARASEVPRDGGARPTGELDPREEEISTLRRTVGQLEHALAARVSIDRAIGVLAERHGTTPREAFEELRGRARSQGRPAQELAVEVLEGLPGRSAVPGQRSGLGAPSQGSSAPSAPGTRPAAGGPPVRRVQRHARRAGEDDALPEASR